MTTPDRYSATFRSLRDRGEGAFVPFLVLGDPDPETSLDLLRAFADGGADMLELGIPFSDPVADGPVIQGADLRALANGIDPRGALELIARFRCEYPDMPVGMLLYSNLIQRPGPERFLRSLAEAGANSVLVADLPFEEGAAWRRAGRDAGVRFVQMATPKTNDDRLARILALPAPYLYVVSRTGVTGRDRSLSTAARPLLRRIRRLGVMPCLLGFGIGKPEHVRATIGVGADGAICGSAIVEIIALHCGAGGVISGSRARRALVQDVRRFVKRMKSATVGA